MYTDPKKAYKEKFLINEIARLESMIFSDDRDEEDDFELKGKVLDSIKENKVELNKVWAQIRKEHDLAQQKTNNLLTAILVTAMFIAVTLVYK